MKIPAAVWTVSLPIIVAAITPIIAQFYPVNEIFWSALIVALGGAVVSAIAAYRQVTAQPIDNPPPAALGQAAPMQAPAPKRAGFVKTWLLGA